MTERRQSQAAGKKANGALLLGFLSWTTNILATIGRPVLVFFFFIFRLLSKIFKDPSVSLIKTAGQKLKAANLRHRLKAGKVFYKKNLQPLRRIAVQRLAEKLEQISVLFKTLAGIFSTIFKWLILQPLKLGLLIFKTPRLFVPRSFIAGFLTATAIYLVLFFSYLINFLPHPMLIAKRDIPLTSKIYDRNGEILYQIYTQENRTPVKLESLPKAVKEATLAIEDDQFYNHQGVSLKSILRAARETILNQKIQGGSTITQQLVKSALLTPEKTLARKLKEVVLALWAEKIYSKDQILEMYLNQVSYGGTAWGIEAAAQTYFGKKAGELNLAESALLAGLPSSPSNYSPFGSHPELAKERQREVLNRMRELNFISPDDFEENLNAPVKFISPDIPIKAPHFVMYVKDELAKKYGERLVERGGLSVKTTLDSAIQAMTEKEIREGVERQKYLNVGNGAALVVDVKSGEILAMVGSKNYFELENDGNVNVALSLRSPGSSIKVVNYALALQNGFTASSILEDAPVVYPVAGNPPYSPQNYDGRFHGRVTLRTALGNSYNVPAVGVLSKIEPVKMLEYGRSLGIKSWRNDGRFGLSLTLGGREVTMLELATVYTQIAEGGQRKELTPFLSVQDNDGSALAYGEINGKPVVNDARAETDRVVPAGVAYILNSILSDDNARKNTFGAGSILNIPGHTTAVKTGTAETKRDNWTIGYTPSYLVAVWVGNNDNTPMSPFLESGNTGAAPIWHNIMVNLLRDKPEEKFPVPTDIIEAPICLGSRQKEYFLKGSEPKTPCPKPTATPSSSPTPN